MVHEATQWKGEMTLAEKEQGPIPCVARRIVLIPWALQGDNWNDLLKEVVTFDSVEEFWGIYVR